MAIFTQYQSGNWSDPYTWDVAGASGTPVATDTIGIFHDINIDINLSTTAKYYRINWIYIYNNRIYSRTSNKWHNYF
jgi:hypothetical protein